MNQFSLEVGSVSQVSLIVVKGVVQVGHRAICKKRSGKYKSPNNCKVHLPFFFYLQVYDSDKWMTGEVT